MTEDMKNRVLNGRYKIIDRIGMGGMAEVYQAQDTVLGRIVAVKIMLPQYSEDPDFTQRFRHEAAAAANLQSPYIVNIYDWGQDHGTYFIVMEYVRGSDLKTGIKERGALNQRKVAEIGSQVCQALSVAHNMDIVHRDIKSQNIMIQPDGNVKVMDFGIARAKNSISCETSSVLGTAHYISPEQAQGKEISGSSDIYSLGVVLYEAATGQLPFDGPDAVSVALKQVNELPLPPHEINPRINPQLEAIILRAMEKDPANRFATANEMRAALTNLLNGRGAKDYNGATVAIPVAGAAAVAGVAAGTHAANSPDVTSVMPSNLQAQRPTNYGPQNSPQKYQTGDPEPEKKSKKVPLIIAAVVVVLIAAGIGAWFFFGKGGVPDVTGKTLDEAKTILTQAGLNVGNVTKEASDSVEEGKVIKQSPEANAKADKGAKVDLVVSEGKEKTIVPAVTGYSEEEATTLLKAAGFEVRTATGEYSTEYAKGKVMKQDPAGKSEAAKGSTVTITVSLGTESVVLPDVTGMSESAAIDTLKSAGFNYGVSYAASPTVEEGLVISQSPAGDGTVKADKGTYVTLVVSTGASNIDIPSDLVGKTVASAYQALTNKGFTNVVKHGSDSAKVTKISPTGSATADTRIDIYGEDAQ